MFEREERSLHVDPVNPSFNRGVMFLGCCYAFALQPIPQLLEHHPVPAVEA